MANELLESSDGLANNASLEDVLLLFRWKRSVMLKSLLRGLERVHFERGKDCHVSESMIDVVECCPQCDVVFAGREGCRRFHC